MTTSTATAVPASAHLKPTASGSAASALAATVAGFPLPPTADESAARAAFQAAYWDIDPDVTFLNHGSYGAAPRAVLAAQSRYRARMEREAVRFFKVDLEHLLDSVRRSIADFVNCDPDRLAPMPNATVAICTVLHNAVQSGVVGPGDQVLVTDHEYMSGMNELNRLATRHGFEVVAAKIPFPIFSPDQVVESVLSAVTPRTKLAMISHVTSATSLIFPVERIVPELLARGVEVMVDGAHAPGQISVDVRALNPTYYVGSGHKWISAPKGTGFLYVHPRKHAGFRPIALSSRAHRIRPERDLYLRDFDYMGTDDYTGVLAIPDALAFLGGLMPGGWPALMARNHDLVLRGREILCRALGCTAPAPAAMIGSMATLIIPEAAPELQDRATLYDDPLQDALTERHGMIVPVWRVGATNARVVRISAQLYNTVDQYEQLARALLEELARERALRSAA